MSPAICASPAPDPNRSPSSSPSATWHDDFLRMLPAIHNRARFSFRHLRPERREEAVQETLANAVVAYVRLVEQDRAGVATPHSLARYAVSQIRSGRRVGHPLNKNDVLSKYAQRERGLRVKSLQRFDEREEKWTELLIEDRTAGPADIAATRVDFRNWLRTLSRRDRRVAQALAAGEKTGTVARMFRISSARISQLRRNLQEAWLKFQGELQAESELAAA